MNNEYFYTSDFCLAITLLSLNLELLKLDRSNPQRIIFLFTNKQKIEPILNAYLGNKVLVTPQAFYSAQRQLKTLMYQGGDYAS